MKLAHILAARPNFIKAASVVKELKNQGHSNYIIHTNQHYDYLMSAVFFSELTIPEPDAHLGIGSGTHAEQTAAALVAIEKELKKENPDYVIVYGDVNSTLSGALAAAKLNIPIIHIESGCRSFDDSMPEEINRKVVDNISSLLTCTEESALDNIKHIDSNRVALVGNTAIDSLYSIKDTPIEETFNYYLATFHRPFNVDDPDSLDSILSKLNEFSLPVIIPAHPRLKKNIKKEYSNIIFKDPLGFLEFINYIKNSSGVISDSGGVQCEACFYNVPLITVRPTTEHNITLSYGNRLADVRDIAEDYFAKDYSKTTPMEWDGNASKRVVKFITDYDSRNS